MKTLKEYAEKHGTTEQAFLDAGYKEVIKDGLKALSFPTNGGLRYRMLDESKGKYKGFDNKQVWYRLDEALKLIESADMPLIITNGEASVVAAQSKGLPATAVTMGEKSSIPQHLLDELLAKYNGMAVYLAFDSDKAGFNASKGIYEQLKPHYSAIPLNFDKDNGYDLADWLFDNPNAVNNDFGRIKLFNFNPVTEITVIDTKEVQLEETAQIIEQISESFPWLEYVEQHFGNVEPRSNGEYKVVGNGYGGFFVNIDKGEWHIFNDDTKRGGVIQLVQYALFGDKYDKNNKKQWGKALHTASEITKINLPVYKGKETIVKDGIVIPQHNGRLKTQEYVMVAQSFGYTVKMNELNDSIEVNGNPLDDTMNAVIKSKFHDEGLYHYTDIENAITTSAYENKYHPLKDYLNSLVWDGQPHLERFISHIKENGSEPVAHIFVKRWFIGAVAKILDRKQNVMLVFVGAQNGGKSTLARWMCPLPKYFIEGPINPDDKDDKIRLVSKMVWEVAELASTTRTRDQDSLKYFITAEEMTIRKPYGRYDIIKPATASMIGTVNHDGAGLFSDTTGNRRFMMVPIESIDFSYTDMDIHQIWAQAVALYRSGESYRLLPDELELQKRTSTDYETPDPLEDVINNFYVADKNGYVASKDILEVVKENGSFGATDKAVSMAIAKTLTKMGYIKHTTGKEKGWKGLKPITTTFGSRLKG